MRQGVESVTTAATQISAGNADLSQRTEEQASALQQTAATMDELGATVRNNADNSAGALLPGGAQSRPTLHPGALGPSLFTITGDGIRMPLGISSL